MGDTNHAQRLRPAKLDIDKVIDNTYAAIVNSRIAFVTVAGEEKSLPLVEMLYKLNKQPNDKILAHHVNTQLCEFIPKCMLSKQMPNVTTSSEGLVDALHKQLEGKVEDVEVVTRQIMERVHEGIKKTIVEYGSPEQANGRT